MPGLSKEHKMDLSLSYHLEQGLVTKGFDNVKKVQKFPKSAADLPSMAFSWEDSSRALDELGTPSKRVDSFYSVNCHAEAAGQLRDIIAVICELLGEQVNLLDFPPFPKLADGSDNPDFDAQAQKIGVVEIGRIRERNLSNPQATVLDRHRGLVEFEAFIRV